MTETDLYTFIAQSKLGVLGTIGESGTPQSSLVGIAVTEDLEIVFDTVKSSRKYRNLVARPACSFAIGWAGERTVQFEGEAQELIVTELLKTYQKVYFQAWPDGPARMSWPGITYFVVRPRWIRYSDFDQRPPLIQEFSFAGAR
jgi:pyridoxine/pyridoxamine 5'-phosphate oxidase